MDRPRLPVPAQQTRRVDERASGVGSRLRPSRRRQARTAASSPSHEAARPSAAPCQARRSAGRGVFERRAWRAAWRSESSRTSTRHDKPVARGRSGAERRERPSRERDNVTNGNVGAIPADADGV